MPDIPTSDIFQVKQAFSGNFAYDNAIIVDLDERNAFFDLQQLNAVIGGVEFSERFLPRLNFRLPDGYVEFLSDGASQGGSTSIETTLNSSSQNHPTAGELNGTTAAFSFNDFQPFGGQVSGQALLTSAVPAVCTWAMMILGFGFVGFAMRRRKPHTGLAPALPF